MEWNVILDYHPALDLDAGEGDLVSDIVEELAGSITISDWLDVVGFRVDVDASDALDAAKKARSKVEAIIRRHKLAPGELVKIEAVPDEWVDRFDLAAAPMAGLTELAERTGLSRQRIHQLAQRPDFPEPAARLASGPVWPMAIALEWLQQPRKAGRPRKTPDLVVHGTSGEIVEVEVKTMRTSPEPNRRSGRQQTRTRSVKP